MAIDLAGADAYFAADNHFMSEVWLQFTEDDHRTAAIASARRQLIRLLARDLDDTTTTDTDFPREDVATYEQALFLLRNGFIANGDFTTPKWTLGDRDADDDGIPSPEKIGICNEAKGWIFERSGPTGGVISSRGA